MTERQRFILRVRTLSRGVAEGYYRRRESLGFPMVKVVEVIRKKHKFNGYVHLKVMPGADYHLVEAAANLGSRLSINIEAPTPDMLYRISPMKAMESDILEL